MPADIVIARLLHVLAVVLWIGGVGFVTLVLLPAVRRSNAADQRVPAFHGLEERFARQSRITTVIAGLSGFYMAWRLDLWSRFESASFWWMHAMVLVWLIFTVMLFVIEPLFLHRAFARPAVGPVAEARFRRIERLHRILLTLSLITVAGAVAGSQGINLFAW
jgi:uncharacterized membrane protein